MTYPDGTKAAYTFDLLGRLTNLKDAENQNTTYAYDAASQLISMAYPNGWSESYSYDAAGRLIREYDKDPSGLVNKNIESTYTYDAQGNITREARNGVGGQEQYDYTHQYDALGRLTRTDGLPGYATHTYQYDSLGNLVYEKNGNGNKKGNEYWYNNLNQQVQKKVDDKDTYSYTYDKRGNLVKGVENKKNTVIESYTYDATGRMVKGVNESGEESRYIYNGLGGLVANEWSFKNNSYGYHGNNVRKDYVLDYTSPLKDVIMETESGSGALTYRYTYGLEKANVVIYGVPNGESGKRFTRS